MSRASLVSIALVSFACARSATPSASEHRITGASYAGPNGHSMIVIRGGEFLMGSPPTEVGRSVAETQHRVRIPRTYAMATTEVTNEQFARFLAEVPDYATRWQRATEARFGNPSRFARYSRTPNSPQ